MPMQLLYSCTYLFHIIGYLDLRHRLTPLHLLKQLTSCSTFQDNINIIFIIKASIHLYYVGMGEIVLEFHLANELVYDVLLTED